MQAAARLVGGGRPSRNGAWSMRAGSEATVTPDTVNAPGNSTTTYQIMEAVCEWKGPKRISRAREKPHLAVRGNRRRGLESDVKITLCRPFLALQCGGHLAQDTIEGRRRDSIGVAVQCVAGPILGRYLARQVTGVRCLSSDSSPRRLRGAVLQCELWCVVAHTGPFIF